MAVGVSAAVPVFVPLPVGAIVGEEDDVDDTEAVELVDGVRLYEGSGVADPEGELP